MWERVAIQNELKVPWLHYNKTLFEFNEPIICCISENVASKLFYVVNYELMIFAYGETFKQAFTKFEEMFYEMHVKNLCSKFTYTVTEQEIRPFKFDFSKLKVSIKKKKKKKNYYKKRKRIVRRIYDFRKDLKSQLSKGTVLSSSTGNQTDSDCITSHS